MCNYVQFSVDKNLFLEFWIGKTCVINCLEFFNKYGLGIGNVTECDRALLEITFSHLRIDEAVDEVADGLLRVVRERA